VLHLAGSLTLFVTVLAIIATQNENIRMYEFEVERSLNGRGSSDSFNAGIGLHPTTLSIWLMAGGALVVGSIFVSRRNFSLRFMLICVFLIGILGMIPGQIITTSLAQMSMRCMFEEPISVGDFIKIDRIKQAMDPALALATWPEPLLQELKLTPRTQVGVIHVKLVSSGAGETAQGVNLNISFSPHLTAPQRETLAEFYAYYFEQLCFEFAKANGLINDTTTSRPWVNGSFYKFQKEWEAKRAEKSEEPER